MNTKQDAFRKIILSKYSCVLQIFYNTYIKTISNGLGFSDVRNGIEYIIRPCSCANNIIIVDRKVK